MYWCIYLKCKTLLLTDLLGINTPEALVMLSDAYTNGCHFFWCREKKWEELIHSIWSENAGIERACKYKKKCCIILCWAQKKWVVVCKVLQWFTKCYEGPCRKTWLASFQARDFKCFKRYEDTDSKILSKALASGSSFILNRTIVCPLLRWVKGMRGKGYGLFDTILYL